MKRPKISLLIMVGTKIEGVEVDLMEHFEGDRLTKKLDIPYPLQIGTRYVEGMDQLGTLSGRISEVKFWADDNEIELELRVDKQDVNLQLVAMLKDPKNGWKEE